MNLRKIDALVAEHVMGWEGVKYLALDNGHKIIQGFHPDLEIVPHYSSDIAAAWSVVEKMAGDDLMPDEQRFSCTVGHGSSGVTWATFERRVYAGEPDEFHHEGPVPLAICLAALKAKGVDPVSEERA